ncbi:hypothetical protein BMW23_0682 [Bodo saltans virus]|uniref:Uncharacterized protein n=1 Tax=Bodo saltans virus TaxID=2024608 RepID=A0A2H4UUX9_9VIRU|nr:hypothetical protein QJ851_gp0665 [Bodo saltans virus]ATZ80728.1 hypothetical protein BMW23_0682 [Bodo saltans virus]
MNKEKDYLENAQNIFAYENRNNFNISQELSNTIHNDMNKIMNDDEYAIILHNKIMTKNKIIRDLLTYDFLNYSPDIQINKFDEFVLYAVDTLKKFHYKVGGFNLEDKDWILTDIDNHRFKIKHNQKILYNSIRKKFYDKDLLWFMDGIIQYINKIADTKKFIAKHTFIEDSRHSLCWIVIKLIDNSMS